MGPVVVDDDECFEPGKLLDESWFFGNLLEMKPMKMSRSLSDPCSSSNFNQELLLPPGKLFDEASIGTRKLDRKTFSDNLPRTPSLPISLQIQEYHDEDTDFSMGKLIRQASLNNSAPTNRSIAQPPVKVVNSMKSSTRNPAPEGPKSEGLEKLKPQFPIRTIQTQKSLNVSQFQGLKGMESDCDNKCWMKGVSSIEEEEKKEEDEEKKSNRSRKLQRSETAIPKWAATMSTEDMKAQLKFWARAVASNVRQEC